MKGIVCRGAIEIPRPARGAGWQVIMSDSDEIPWPQTLFISPPVNVPWDLLDTGFDFLDSWECAAPVWRYDVTAADVARGDDVKRTQALLHDLRVPLYAHELLFARDCDSARALLATWRVESAAVADGDARLSFLRALYIVKPFFLALPRSWLSDIKERGRHDGRFAASRAAGAEVLVRVQVGPNRYVRCRAGDEEKVKAEFADREISRRTRRGRNARGK